MVVDRISSTHASVVVEAVSSTMSETTEVLSTSTSTTEAVPVEPEVAPHGGEIIPTFFRVCSEAPNYNSDPRCKGPCSSGWIRCNTTGLEIPPQQIHSGLRKQPINCIETNTTIPFDVCNWKRRTCHRFDVFHPRMNSQGLRVFYTPSTHWVDIHCHEGPHPKLQPA